MRNHNQASLGSDEVTHMEEWSDTSWEALEGGEVEQRGHGTSAIGVLVLGALVLPVKPDLVDHLCDVLGQGRSEESSSKSNTNSMVHEEQGIVRSPFWSTDTSGGTSATGTVASHVTSNDHMGATMSALHRRKCENRSTKQGVRRLD